MTAVEWFVREIAMKNNDINFDFWAAVEQAKEMEEQQIIDAWESGYVEGAGVNDFSIYHGNVYYNNTFKIKKDF